MTIQVSLWNMDRGETFPDPWTDEYPWPGFMLNFPALQDVILLFLSAPLCRSPGTAVAFPPAAKGMCPPPGCGIVQRPSFRRQENGGHGRRILFSALTKEVRGTGESTTERKQIKREPEDWLSSGSYPDNRRRLEEVK
ncbi:hypothetical protein ACLG6S_14225 [Thermodesulfobacteriota bacterium B35]